MAGTSSFDANQNIDNVVLSWMFDYICYRTWDQFSKNTAISETDKDAIQGLSGLVKDIEVQPTRTNVHQKWLFILNICRLDDGEDVTIKYEDEDDEIPLESMLSTFEKLVKLQPPPLKEEGMKLVPVIKSEAVLVCCRAGAFETAKRLLSTFWKTGEKHDNEQKLLRNMLNVIVKSKNTKDETLVSYTYRNFIDSIKIYLEKIFRQFPTPVLVEAGERWIEAENKNIEESKNSRKRSRNSGADTLKNSIDKDSRATYKEASDRAKLRKLWNQNVTELFVNEQNQATPASEPRSAAGLMPPPVSSPLRKGATKTQSIPGPSLPSGQAENRKESQVTATGDRPVTSTSPKESTSGSDMRYKKNVGRQNRHEPDSTNPNQNQNQNNRWETNSLSLSMISNSSHVKKKWTEGEMEEFFDAVQKCGVGQWSTIKEYLDTNRTNVMLKDKWRTMVKNGDADRLAKTLKKKSKK